MYIPGHISVGYLLAAGPALARGRLLETKAVLLPVVAGALTPDLVDKTIYALEFSPYGRTVGHSMYLVVIVALLWKSADLRGWRYSRVLGWWLAGWASHLVADLVDDLSRGLEHTGYLFAAWWGWPFANPDMGQIQIEAADGCSSCYTMVEIGVLALALAVGIASYVRFDRGGLE